MRDVISGMTAAKPTGDAVPAPPAPPEPPEPPAAAPPMPPVDEAPAQQQIGEMGEGHKGGPLRVLDGRGPHRESSAVEGGGPKHMNKRGELELRTCAPPGEVCQMTSTELKAHLFLHPLTQIDAA